MQPTHKRGDQQANILDLILINEENMKEDLRYEAPLGKRHHCSLVFKFKCYAEYKSSNVKTFKYANGDYEKLRALVRECDLIMVEDIQMEEGWIYLEENITTAMNKIIPKSNRNEGQHNRSNRPMWMNNTALVKVKSKNESYKCYRNTMKMQDFEKKMLRLGTKHAGSGIVRQRSYLNAPWQKRPNRTIRLFSAMPIAN